MKKSFISAAAAFGIALALSTRTVYADEISMFADPHDAELARNSIKVESVDDKK